MLDFPKSSRCALCSSPVSCWCLQVAQKLLYFRWIQKESRPSLLILLKWTISIKKDRQATILENKGVWKALVGSLSTGEGVLQNANCFGSYSIKKVQKKIEVTLYCWVIQDTSKLPQQSTVFQVFYDSQQFPFKGERRSSGEMAPLALWLARVSI